MHLRTTVFTQSKSTANDAKSKIMLIRLDGPRQTRMQNWMATRSSKRSSSIEQQTHQIWPDFRKATHWPSSITSIDQRHCLMLIHSYFTRLCSTTAKILRIMLWKVLAVFASTLRSMSPVCLATTCCKICKIRRSSEPWKSMLTPRTAGMFTHQVRQYRRIKNGKAARVYRPILRSCIS